MTPGESGGVVIPAWMARPVLAVLVRGLKAQAQNDGGVPMNPAVVGLVKDLHAVDQASMSHMRPGPGAAESIGDVKKEPAWSGATEAAAEVGLSVRQVQRLCKSGAVEVKRLGSATGTYLVNIESLKDHLRS